MPTWAHEAIKATHRKTAEYLATVQDKQPHVKLEPVEVALAVEEHRWAWKPDKVRLVLIAESHVYTSPQDLKAKVTAGMLPGEAHQAPAQFVRFIYCLGYGEQELLEEPKPQSNPGTFQFWTIFARAAGTTASKPASSAPLAQKVAWKIETLKALQAKGIWLLDASVHAFYFPGEGQDKIAPANGKKVRDVKKLLPACGKMVHRLWWQGYGKQLLNTHCQSASRWVIGHGVAHAAPYLFNEADCGKENWIYQPNASIKKKVKEERMAKLLAVVEVL
jgi:hypothetical protein